ncbi:hypothetical protein RZS08_47230, partial [Arthrospira platensis SPKY1]|nr:hypothetical protein [Arthrospira platensis SPKY1]
IGYLSMRRSEEDIINESLNSGCDTFSVIIDPYFKTIVNNDNCVHIGSRIFKFYDNGGVAIILNNNWIVYDSIKDMQYEDLQSNEALFITNWDVKNWHPVYDLDEN